MIYIYIYKQLETRCDFQQRWLWQPWQAHWAAGCNVGSAMFFDFPCDLSWFILISGLKTSYFFRIFRLLFRIKKHQTEKQVTSLNMSADGSDTVRSCSKPPFHLPWGHKGCNIMLALTRRVKRMVRFGLQNRWLLLDALLPNYLILYNSWPIPRFFWWWL